MEPDLLFARGRDAADRGNYDYAIAVFRDVLRVHPDHLKSRIALRGSELTRFQEKGGGVKGTVLGFLAGLGDFIAMYLPGRPEKVIERCENYLEHQPLSTRALKKLARACKAAGHLEAAVNTLEFLRHRSPGKTDVLRMLGDMYAEKEDYARAVRCYEELSSLRPNDRMINDRLRNLSAAQHMHHTKLEETKSYRESIRDEERAKVLEKEQHIIRTQEDADEAVTLFQAKLKDDPNDVETLLKLGDVYRLKKEFKFAMAAYNKALEIAPRRYDVLARIGDLRIGQLEEQEREATDAAKSDPENPELRHKAEEIRQQRLTFAIQEYERRAREYPTDLRLAHRLGSFYWEQGSPESIEKAISCFQRSVEDPKFTLQARYMLGQCFANDPKTRDMAISQFEQALELSTSPTGNIAKAIQYNLGQLHEQTGDRQKALDWYKKVFAIDAGFRDVREKVKELS